MSSKSASRGIPAVPEGLSDDLTLFLTHVRRIASDVQAGRTPASQAGSGSSGGSGGGSGGGGGGGGDYEPDLTPPPSPSGVNVVAGMDFVGITTDPPTFSMGHGYLATVVYGAKYSGTGPLPSFANAGQVGDFIGEVGSFPTDAATQWHIWVKWKTRDGVLSVDPTGGANGFQVTTGQDVSRLLDALQGMLRNEQLDPTSNFRFKANLFTIQSASGTPAINPFTVITTPTMTPAGEQLPVGVYMEATYIKNLEAALGRFTQAFITNAMIVSVSASRITSGVINVGNYIQASNYVPGVSGWRIHGDGSAEFAAASIRGKLSAANMNGQGLTITRPNGSVVLDASGTGSAFSWLDIGGRPAEDSIRNNLIDLAFWKRLGAIPWPQNQEENVLYATSDVGGVGPKGGSDIVWYAREASNNGENGGGWESAPVTGVDPSKTYRFVVPIRKRSGVGGNAYWGPLWGQVCDLNTTNSNGNPYFANIGRDSLQPDRWYLFVGYVFPYGSTGNTHDGAGIYDCKTGALVAGGVNFNHNVGGANGHRAYQYYASPQSTQLFGRPMINLVDGSEPSLREYFESSAVLASAIAYGTNLIANSDQSAAMTMAYGNTNGSAIDVGLQWASNIWATEYTLQGGTTKNVTIHQNNDNGSGDGGVGVDIYPLGPWDLAHSVPVVPGQRYCFSAYLQAHRCHVGVGIYWFDRMGNFIADIGTGAVAVDNPWGPADSLQFYRRPSVIGVAPGNAGYARPYIRKYNTMAPYTESWFWAAAPQMEAVGPAATGPGPYSPAPATSTRQLGYSGDLNATYGATIGQNLGGTFSQSTFDVVMNGQALIRGAHIQSLTVQLLSTAWNGGAAGAHIELALNKQTFFRGNGTKSIELIA